MEAEDELKSAKWSAEKRVLNKLDGFSIFIIKARSFYLSCDSSFVAWIRDENLVTIVSMVGAYKLYKEQRRKLV